MPDRITKPEYREQWMKAKEEVHFLLTRAAKLESLLDKQYEGVLGESVPDYDPELRWDKENVS